MADPRHQKLAEVLINYSLGIKPGDLLLLVADMQARPLLRETYREALRAGANIVVRLLPPPELAEIKLREGSEAQLSYVSPFELEELRQCDALLTLVASENTKALSKIKPERLALEHRSLEPLTELFMRRSASGELRWCGTLFPTNAQAQHAGMSLSDYEDFVFGAGLLNETDPAAEWRKLAAEQQRIADFLMSHDEIRVVAPDTDLTYRVGGRLWINASGQKNFPDGEVFTGPIEDSVNGTVRFSYPAIYAGNEVEDVRLTFRDGKVVEATAARGLEFLEAMIDQDEGARYVGEVAFGLNYGIQQFTGHVAFDEKIGGTMHMALGASYPDTGGTNKSTLHWDMVCDLRQGQVFADGQQCYSDGKFLI